MIEAQEIPLTLCRMSPTARPIRDGEVLALMASIEQIGLRQPINVRPRTGGYEVRGGGHRLEAFRRLGRETIPAIIRDDDDLHAELAEIDENLIRNELSPAERSIAIGRRKAIYEALHPETAAGVAGGKARQGTASDKLSFAESTAQTTGKNRRTIERDAHRSEALGEETLRTVTGTSLDTGEELDALAKLAPDHRNRLIERAAAGDDVSAKAGDAALPNGFRALMGSRQEPDDSLDYFPTPPWATRALCQHVMPVIGLAGKQLGVVWEPACGEGHIAGVLGEYADEVIASDIHDYGYSDQYVVDFLTCEQLNRQYDADWIITNPPFDEKAVQFALHALELARHGVALFVRWQWIESVGRYEKLFKPHPPTLVCPFAERVPLHKGRWEPKGTTATAYCWVVWHKQSPSWGTGLPTLLHWIPPGCRESVTYLDDVKRFAAWSMESDEFHDPETGELTESEAQRESTDNPESLAPSPSAMGPHECGSGPPESVIPTRAAHSIEGDIL